MIKKQSYEDTGKSAQKKKKSANTLILDFQSPKLWENTFLLFTPSVYGNFYGCSSKLKQKAYTKEYI